MAGNDYDNVMYVYSKGPSATTISAPDTVVPKGTAVLIKGTVTDQSPGAPGTPAISDVDQEKWMEFLYMKQAKPTNLNGVPVHLTATDPNGNFQDLGVVNSDMSGLYSALWTPPVEGKYTVTATFAGSESYGSSQASTAFGVGAAQVVPIVTSSPIVTATPNPTAIQTNTPSPSPSVQPPGSEMPITTLIAIGAAVIIIVVVAAALVLRRRK